MTIAAPYDDCSLSSSCWDRWWWPLDESDFFDRDDACEEDVSFLQIVFRVRFGYLTAELLCFSVFSPLVFTIYAFFLSSLVFRAKFWNLDSLAFGWQSDSSVSRLHHTLRFEYPNVVFWNIERVIFPPIILRLEIYLIRSNRLWLHVINLHRGK